MRKFISLLILSLLSVSVLTNKLSILEGQSQISKKDFDFSISDFGDIPYGQTVIGAVFKANPFDACTKIDPVNLTEIGNTIIPIVLIQRGGPDGVPSTNCHFVDKAKNAENAGYKVAIMEDNINEAGVIIMADDGRGHSIHIPSIFISRANGVALETDIQKSQDELVFVKIYFEIEQRNRSEYTFIMQPNDRLTQSFLLQFNNYRDAFKAQTHMNLRYNFFKCEGCLQDKANANANCLGGGLYCQIDPDGPYSPANGQVSGYETIRQICIYEKYGEDAWYSYIRNFYRYCPLERAADWEECSVREQKLTEGVDPAVIQECFYDSFETSNQKIEFQRNHLIEKYLPKNNEYYYISSQRMTIRINNMTYYGKLNPYDVAEAICSSLVEPSELCEKIIDGLVIKSDYTVSQEELLKRSGMSVTSIVLITVSVLVVIFIIILIIYKKLVGREMKNEMDTQVNEMVTNYIKFYEQKDKNKSGIV